MQYHKTKASINLGVSFGCSLSHTAPQKRKLTVPRDSTLDSQNFHECMFAKNACVVRHLCNKRVLISPPVYNVHVIYHCN